MSPCAYIKSGGERCKARAMEGYDTCYSHRPDLAGERRRNARKGGKSGGRGRPQTETDGLKQEIRSVIGGVLAGKIPQGRAAIMFQGFNALLRVHELERRKEAAGDDGRVSHEEMLRQGRMFADLAERHLPREGLRAFNDELGALLDEASGDG